MIDTVVLQWDCQDEEIKGCIFTAQDFKRLNRFVAVSTVFSGVHKECKKKGIYYPMILARKRTANGKEEGVKLEMQISLPKALHGTNLYEVTPDDLGKIYLIIQGYLKQSGVEMSIEKIKAGVLKRVDFSKIIRIPSMYGTARQVVKKLSSFDYKQCSDFVSRDYGHQSNGIAMKFYNDTQGYILYDKIPEIQSNGYTEQEKRIIDWYDQAKQRKDVLRFEINLERKQSMEAVLRRFVPNKKKNFTLSDILSASDISKKILLEAFNKVFNKTYLPLITLAEMHENKLEVFLREQNLPITEHSQISYWVNMVYKVGLEATLEYMREKYPNTSFGRYKNKLLAIIEKVGNIEGEVPSLVNYLRRKHEEFKLISPKVDNLVVNHC